MSKHPSDRSSRHENERNRTDSIRSDAPATRGSRPGASEPGLDRLDAVTRPVLTDRVNEALARAKECLDRGDVLGALQLVERNAESYARLQAVTERP